MLSDDVFRHRLEERKQSKIIVRHLIRKAPLLRDAGVYLLSSGFLDDDPDLKLLLEIVQQCFDEHGELPSRDMIMLELSEERRRLLLTSPEDAFDEDGLSRYKWVLDKWFTMEEFSEKYVRNVLEEHIRQYHADWLRDQLDEGGTVEELAQDIAEVGRLMARGLSAELEEETAWKDPWNSIVEVQKQTLGITFIDQALDGGLGEGECFLCIAPSGGGKTALGLQCSSHQVDQSRHTVYLSTEQPLRGDLSIRQLSLGGRVKRSLLMKGKENLPPDVIDAVERAKPRWLEYFHFIDCRRSRRSISTIADLFTPIDALIKEGKAPSLIVLDWWGRLRNRLIMEAGTKDTTMVRYATSDWLASLVDGIKERNTRLLVLHQVKGASAAKGAKAHLTTHDAQEDSNLNNLFEFGAALSKMNKDNCCRIAFDKARSTARTEGFLQLMGDECRFRSVDASQMDLTELTAEPAQEGALDLDDFNV